MPKKYHVSIKALPPRYELISEFCAIEISPCLRCRGCVKLTACVYGIEGKRGFDHVQVVDTGDYQCVSCFRCIQECKANILTRVRNSRFDALGNDYWKPELIKRIWKQAETGKIPVSGAGYRGPFCGPGFDQMWTDMSEIVRPTRDGIHGREYISTLVDLGRKPGKLAFDDKGNLLTEPSALVEIPLPVILDIPPVPFKSEAVRKSFAAAAASLGTLAVAGFDEARDGVGLLAGFRKNLAVRIDPAAQSISDAQGAAMLELAWSDNVMDAAARIREQSRGAVVSIRLPLDEHAAQRVSQLTAAGAQVIHLQAGPDGTGMGGRSADFITGLVREVHLRLVEDSVRDQVTLLMSGGIVMAEHVAKIIICGVDAVGVDLAALVALECRLCPDCGKDVECPVRLDELPADRGAQRIVNLMGSWHSQLIEVMGAMGIRDVRRLRGEVGRAMFFDDLEKNNFAPIFGERKPAAAGAAAGAAARQTEPEKTKEPWTFPLARGRVKTCASRYRNRLSKYRVIRTDACTSCGACAAVCAHGVFMRTGGGRNLTPSPWHCVGPDACRAAGALCVDACPAKAIRVGPDPMWETFGDARWPADLIAATWIQAQTGRPPENGFEYKVGASGGGFDSLDFVFPAGLPDPAIKPENIDLSIPLNRRNDDERPRIEIGFPVYGGGMSFGSVSLATLVSRAIAYRTFKSFTCTGEGGYPDALIPYKDNVITQVATGLFGVREETILRAPVVEFKYAQGAKPGLGGHLLGDKVTPAVARIRESVEGNALFSPFPFHSVYSVEDHKKHVDWIKAINPRALVSVKVSSPTDVDMVAVGSYYAGAHIIHIDGSYGGTGAAPDIAKKNIAMPVEYAIPMVHNFLVEEGVRDRMTFVASGGIRSAWDIAKAIALGADCVVIGTSEMTALECIRCANCESGRGCPRGIATTDPELSVMVNPEWASQRLINLFNSYAVQLQEILWRLGMKSVRELVGRSDLLTHRDYIPNPTRG